MRLSVVIVAVFFLVLNSASRAQTPPPSLEAKPLALETKVTSVTLYRGRASVTRSAAVQLEPGVYDLQISGLPESIQPQTIQARTQGAVKVLNVDYTQEQTTTPPAQFAELDARIDDLARQLKEINEQRDLIKAQEQFIDALSAKVSADAGKEAGTAQFNLEAMRQQLAFIAEERGKLLTARRELDAKQRELEKQLKAAQDKRNSMASTGNVSRTATVTVVATEPASATIDLVYLVSNATWEPSYNVRASISGGTSQIEYDALLTQRTGEDWDDVRLVLSTAQPTIAANPPALQPWFVDIYQPEYLGREVRGAPAEPVAKSPAPMRAKAPAGDQDDFAGYAADASIGGEGPSVSFELPRAVTVKTNIQKQQRTRIAMIETKAKFTHVATPVLTDAVYVRGELTNSSAYQILPGRASIFIGQDYVGPTNLESVAPNGEFKLHFGIDPSVKATRQMVTKKTENTGLLGGGRRTSYDYRILIDNGSGKAITLELWDRYPISRSSEIQIETVDLSHPLATDSKFVTEEQPQGLLKWLLNVPAGATGRSAVAVTFGVRINRAKDIQMTPLPE